MFKKGGQGDFTRTEADNGFDNMKNYGRSSSIGGADHTQPDNGGFGSFGGGFGNQTQPDNGGFGSFGGNFAGFGGNDPISRTVPDQDDEKTSVDEDGDSGRGYVAGWLVAVDGPLKGQDYRVYSNGYNRIGRHSEFEVFLQDKSITREFDMWLCYDPRVGSFQVGGAKACKLMAYVNGELLSPGMMKAIRHGDTIRLGKTTLYFVPLCGSGFSWTADSEPHTGA